MDNNVKGGFNTGLSVGLLGGETTLFLTPISSPTVFAFDAGDILTVTINASQPNEQFLRLEYVQNVARRGWEFTILEVADGNGDTVTLTAHSQDSPVFCSNFLTLKELLEAVADLKANKANADFSNVDFANLPQSVRDQLPEGDQGPQGQYQLKVFTYVDHGDPAPTQPTGGSPTEAPDGWSYTFPGTQASDPATYDIYESFTVFDPATGNMGLWSVAFKTDAEQGPPGTPGPVNPANSAPYAQWNISPNQTVTNISASGTVTTEWVDLTSTSTLTAGEVFDEVSVNDDGSFAVKQGTYLVDVSISVPANSSNKRKSFSVRLSSTDGTITTAMTPSVYDRGFSAQSGTNVFGGMIMLKVDAVEENFKLQSIAIITESGTNAIATTGTVGWTRIVVGERGRTGADGRFPLYIYTNSATTPTAPTASTYTTSSDTLTGITGWTRVPVNPQHPNTPVSYTHLTLPTKA